MLIRIDQASDEPLYLQIRTQVIASIARGEIAPGFTLPSVRALARDLGINLHTVNKAYAVLRDEGYITMRGRAGAVVADPAKAPLLHKRGVATQRMAETLHDLALAHRARGGSADEFLAAAQEALTRAFGKDR
ncbi:MAG: GntR family transcriptional regulator [Eggerthellaceae bacterium]|jgi:DNA-binding transcriptional regulator YhcF (GntR family)|nr:GntR family transcriptional regulator [Eggerthellaceae bacterium]MDR2715706.1 GntR family transcriptional regulator [Coriobacteriaceae bacterium]